MCLLDKFSATRGNQNSGDVLLIPKASIIININICTKYYSGDALPTRLNRSMFQACIGTPEHRNHTSLSVPISLDFQTFIQSKIERKSVISLSRKSLASVVEENSNITVLPPIGITEQLLSPISARTMSRAGIILTSCRTSTMHLLNLSRSCSNGTIFQ